jgi:hypothetical protein
MEKISVKPKGGSEDHHELNLIIALTDAEQDQCTVNILVNLHTRIGRAK